MPAASARLRLALAVCVNNAKVNDGAQAGHHIQNFHKRSRAVDAWRRAVHPA